MDNTESANVNEVVVPSDKARKMKNAFRHFKTNVLHNMSVSKFNKCFPAELFHVMLPTTPSKSTPKRRKLDGSEDVASQGVLNLDPYCTEMIEQVQAELERHWDEICQRRKVVQTLNVLDASTEKQRDDLFDLDHKDLQFDWCPDLAAESPRVAVLRKKIAVKTAEKARLEQLLQSLENESLELSTTMQNHQKSRKRLESSRGAVTEELAKSVLVAQELKREALAKVMKEVAA